MSRPESRRAGNTRAAVSSRKTSALSPWHARGLVGRAHQWIGARERLLARWFARASLGTALLGRASNSSSSNTSRRDAAPASVLSWWEYESPILRQLALEATLRHLFSLIPTPATR